MRVQNTITAKIDEAFKPQHLEVVNESHQHSVPPGSESHFKVVVVSDDFAGKPLVRRHQAVNAVLAEELRSEIHALSMETLTAEEWQARGGAVMASPDCRGGGKADH